MQAVPSTRARPPQDALPSRYVVERELGRGGMAVVYLARDRQHDAPVAVKVLRPEIASLLSAARFAREVRITARLRHPHLRSPPQIRLPWRTGGWSATHTAAPDGC